MVDIEKELEELARLQKELNKPLPVFDNPEQYEPYLVQRQAMKDRISELRKMVDFYEDSLHTEPDPRPNGPEMVSIREAAKRSGLSYNFLRNGCMEGKIVHIVTGSVASCRKRYLINMDKLNEYLNKGDPCCQSGR